MSKNEGEKIQSSVQSNEMEQFPGCKVNTNYLDRFIKGTTIAPDLLRMHV